MTKASDNAFPSILITEGTEPSAPAAGKQRLYIDSTTHKLKRTDSSGTDVTVEGGLADTGTVTYLDFTTAAAPSSPAAGKIRVYSKTGDTLAQKTSGGTETVFGAGGGGSGALTLLEQYTASSSATLDFTTISSTYDTYKVEFVNVVPASDAALIMRMGTGAGPTWDSGGNYAFTNHRENAAGSASEVATGQTQLYISSSDTANTKILSSATNFGVSGFLELTTAGYPRIVGRTYFMFQGSGRNAEQIYGVYESATALTGIRFLMHTGNIASGTIRLYGIAKT